MLSKQFILQQLVEATPAARNLRAMLSKALGSSANLGYIGNDSVGVYGISFSDLKDAVQYAEKRLNKRIDFSTYHTLDWDFEVYFEV